MFGIGKLKEEINDLSREISYLKNTVSYQRSDITLLQKKDNCREGKHEFGTLDSNLEAMRNYFSPTHPGFAYISHTNAVAGRLEIGCVNCRKLRSEIEGNKTND